MCFSPFKDTLTGYHAAFPCLQLQCHGYGKDLCVGKAIKNYLPSPDSTRPGPLFEGNPVGEGTTRRGTATPVHTARQGA